MKRKRLFFGIASLLLFVTELLIGLYAHGFVRNYIGDVLVVILIYTLFRTASPKKPKASFLLPACILVFAFAVEFLQLWGFCDKFGIENRLLRIIIGTGFSVEDLVSYFIGIIPCCVAELCMKKRILK